MKTIGNVKPDLTKAVGNGTFEVYFDVEKVERESHNGEDTEPQTEWAYDIVTVPSLEYSLIVSAIVRERFDNDTVQAILANKAIADNASSVITESKRDEYLDEYDDYQMWREHAKEIAAEVTGRDKDTDSLELAKVGRIADANDYYNAIGYKASYKGIELRLDYETRAKLRNRLEAEEANGLTSTVVWYEGSRFDLPIATTKQMLTALEVYASQCFDVHNQHISEINKLEDEDAIGKYDITKGYPKALEF